jgi:hypothetical protein
MDFVAVRQNVATAHGIATPANFCELSSAADHAFFAGRVGENSRDEKMKRFPQKCLRIRTSS